MSEFDDMARDGGYRGDEARQVARILEEQERARAMASEEDCPHVNRYRDDFLGQEHCDDCGALLS